MRTRLLAALSLAITIILGLVSTTPAQAVVPPGKYVALGDSFSAGSGVLPLSPWVNPLCAQTTRNYPHLLAQRTGRPLTDVTCGGADTSDLYSAQYPGVPAQLNAVTADTALVTVGIGGNNDGVFIDAITKCATAGVGTLGFGSPCKNRYGNQFVDKIRNNTYPAVRQALLDIRARAPQATIAILGYPRILPETGGCFLKMPVARGDVPYLNDLERTLNAVIAQAAAETGATYVDMWGVSAGRDACAPISQRWVEPLLFGTNFVPVHPNAAGEAAMADQLAVTLGL